MSPGRGDRQGRGGSVPIWWDWNELGGNSREEVMGHRNLERHKDKKKDKNVE